MSLPRRIHSLDSSDSDSAPETPVLKLSRVCRASPASPSAAAPASPSTPRVDYTSCQPSVKGDEDSRSAVLLLHAREAPSRGASTTSLLSDTGSDALALLGSHPQQLSLSRFPSEEEAGGVDAYAALMAFVDRGAAWELSDDDSEPLSISVLPLAVVGYALSFLEYDENVIMSRVCRSWRDIIFRNPDLVRVNLTNLRHKLNDAAVLQLCTNFPHVEEINLSGCFDISDTAMVAIGSHCKSLRLLNISRCFSVTDEGISALHGCSSLETLIAWGCRSLSSEALTALQERIPSLRTPLS